MIWYEGTATSGYNTYPREVMTRVTVINGEVLISIHNVPSNFTGTVTIPWQSSYSTTIPNYPVQIKPPKNWKWFDFLRTHKPYYYRKSISKSLSAVTCHSTCVSRAQKAAQKRKRYVQALRTA